MQDRSRQFDEIFLQRTAGPYIGSKCEILIPSRCLPLCLRTRTLLDAVGTSHLCHRKLSRRTILRSISASIGAGALDRRVGCNGCEIRRAQDRVSVYQPVGRRMSLLPSSLKSPWPTTDQLVSSAARRYTLRMYEAAVPRLRSLGNELSVTNLSYSVGQLDRNLSRHP
jgi:hypothetical protein